jgi:hypothetical protein
VLAARMLKFGRPLAYDGVNLVTLDYFATEDIEHHRGTHARPQSGGGLLRPAGRFQTRHGLEVAALGSIRGGGRGLKLLGHDTLGARAAVRAGGPGDGAAVLPAGEEILRQLAHGGYLGVAVTN